MQIKYNIQTYRKSCGCWAGGPSCQGSTRCKMFSTLHSKSSEKHNAQWKNLKLVILDQTQSIIHTQSKYKFDIKV